MLLDSPVRKFNVGCLMTITATLLLASFLGAVQDRTPAENLTIIEGPTWGKREQTLNRFRFLLGKFDRLCQWSGGAPPSDMLAFTNRKIKEAGLGESLLDMSNTLHRLVTDVVDRNGKETEMRRIVHDVPVAEDGQGRIPGRGPESCHSTMDRTQRSLIFRHFEI